METVEMDLMQAQIGSLATDVSRLEAKVAKGGGGGTGGGFAILTVGADNYGLICSNPNADIINLEKIYETNIAGYRPIYFGSKTVFKNYPSPSPQILKVPVNRGLQAFPGGTEGS